MSIFGNRRRLPRDLRQRGNSSRPHGRSKAAPCMNSDFKDLLTDLNDFQVKYLVVGGYAFIHYVEPRYTKDIDIWIEPTPENAIRLRDALVSFGGWVEGMSLEHFSMERTLFQIGLPPARVDFLTSISGLVFDSAYAGRKTVLIGDMTVPFISLPDLMIAKKVAGRPQDLIDLEALQRVATTEITGG